MFIIRLRIENVPAQFSYLITPDLAVAGWWLSKIAQLQELLQQSKEYPLLEA